MKAALIGAVFILLAGWYIDHLQDENQAQSDALATAQQNNTNLQERIDLLDRQVAANEKVNQGYEESRNNDALELENLRAAITAQPERLQLNATCPPVHTRAAQDATSAQSGTDGARPELTAAARQDYLNLRAGISASKRQIEGLQEYINNVCLAAPKAPGKQ